MKGMTYVFVIHSQNDQTTHNVNKSHNWHNFFSYSGNSFNSTNENKTCNNSNNDTYIKWFYAKGGLKRASNGIGLHHISHKSQG
ncbi:hypothetical protein EVA_14911 [gut metagenome]|uniref:Uncharacterized protein n=1 Tax=gut metagenome TaxID=749906 RepID=J9G583_9ZZZZ